ncbi:MAG: hypothetical protein IKE51_04140 [Solobacterium sp.]|nr:hypothetical protein [Solobacterium sp.]
MANIIVGLMIVLIVLWDIKYLLSGKASDCSSCHSESCSSCNTVNRFKRDLQKAKRDLQNER